MAIIHVCGLGPGSGCAIGRHSGVVPSASHVGPSFPQGCRETPPLPVTEGSSPGKLIRDLTPKWGWCVVSPSPQKRWAPEGLSSSKNHMVCSGGAGAASGHGALGPRGGWFSSSPQLPATTPLGQFTKAQSLHQHQPAQSEQQGPHQPRRSHQMCD